ncbi:MAG: hypothetical protein IPH53_14230 [Flavobacteriales bacterium]|nr:hypothetical protein [Flavobacteriales bacterium]
MPAIDNGPVAMRGEPLEKIDSLLRRYDRFAYDLRGECRVLYGIVVAYRAADDALTTSHLPRAIARALAHDGILGAWRDPATERVVYESCRLFTDQEHALRFARAQGQCSVHNLNRMLEIAVTPSASRSMNGKDATALLPQFPRGL